jgi:hypothetical protein
MYFAVQMMAAELSTGALVWLAVRNSNADISMLVGSASSEYEKKAVGAIRFLCEDGPNVETVVSSAIKTGEPQRVTLVSTGFDSQGDVVSRMRFDWLIKAK